MTPINRDAFLDTLFALDQNLRNEDEAINKVLLALDAVDVPPVRVSPIQVQSAQECIAPAQVDKHGKVLTPAVYADPVWEVVDRRKPRLERIVKSFEGEDAEDKARAHAALHAPIGGGAYIYAAVDTDEPWHDSDVEQIANITNYNVISGCTLSFDATNLTVDLAAGVATHSGTSTTVAGGTDAYTVTADGSNERWVTYTVSSAGAAVLVAGDAAASASVEPSKPEPGDRVVVGMSKVQAAQTIAANFEYNLDKRVMGIVPAVVLAGSSSAATSTTSTSAVDLVTISSLSITVDKWVRIPFNYRKQALAATSVGFGLKINSTTVVEASSATWMTATNQAEDGFGEWIMAPRDATHLAGLTNFHGTAVSSTGANAQSYAFSSPNPAALIPNATITSIAIRAINNTTSNAAEVTSIRIYTY